MVLLQILRTINKQEMLTNISYPSFLFWYCNIGKFEVIALHIELTWSMTINQLTMYVDLTKLRNHKQSDFTCYAQVTSNEQEMLTNFSYP